MSETTPEDPHWSARFAPVPFQIPGESAKLSESGEPTITRQLKLAMQADDPFKPQKLVLGPSGTSVDLPTPVPAKPNPSGQSDIPVVRPLAPRAPSAPAPSPETDTQQLPPVAQRPPVIRMTRGTENTLPPSQGGNAGSSAIQVPGQALFFSGTNSPDNKTPPSRKDQSQSAAPVPVLGDFVRKLTGPIDRTVGPVVPQKQEPSAPISPERMSLLRNLGVRPFTRNGQLPTALYTRTPEREAKFDSKTRAYADEFGILPTGETFAFTPSLEDQRRPVGPTAALQWRHSAKSDQGDAQAEGDIRNELEALKANLPRDLEPAQIADWLNDKLAGERKHIAELQKSIGGIEPLHVELRARGGSTNQFSSEISGANGVEFEDGQAFPVLNSSEFNGPYSDEQYAAWKELMPARARAAALERALGDDWLPFGKAIFQRDKLQRSQELPNEPLRLQPDELAERFETEPRSAGKSVPFHAGIEPTVNTAPQKLTLGERSRGLEIDWQALSPDEIIRQAEMLMGPPKPDIQAQTNSVAGLAQLMEE